MSERVTDELAPLVDIERRVQERAKDLALDLGTTQGSAGLRALIDEEINRWNEDHKRGRRPVELVDPAAVAERGFRNLAGYGPLGPLLDDDDVWEIMINAPEGVLVSCQSR